jgi:hypothetical protein
MKPLVFILALYLEPVGSVLEEPWNFTDEIETIDVIPMEELERKLRHRDLRQRYRILENEKGCQE